MTFQFRYLSGILPAYPDRNEDNGQRVWGYGAPNDGKISKIELSIQHILDTLDREGPFAGIVGFSSGAAMAAIIASLLEKKEFVCNIPWKVNSPLYSMASLPLEKYDRLNCDALLDQSTEAQFRYLSQWVQVRIRLPIDLPASNFYTHIARHRDGGSGHRTRSNSKPGRSMPVREGIRIFWHSLCSPEERIPSVL